MPPLAKTQQEKQKIPSSQLDESEESSPKSSAVPSPRSSICSEKEQEASEVPIAKCLNFCRIYIFLHPKFFFPKYFFIIICWH